MSLPPEILKQVQRIEIQTRKLVNNLFAGEYHTAFRGQGMTFAEMREYVPGDDVRHISWSLTAKAGKPYIKKYDEERELTLILAVDISASTNFGSQKYLKSEVITYMAAILGFSATRNNDRVGLLLFSDQVEHFVPPSKGRGHVHRIIRDLLYFEPKSKKTKIEAAVTHLRQVVKKKAQIFFFSDFLDENFETSLKLLSKKHDIVSVVVGDPAEKSLPKVGLIELQDAETGESLLVDSNSSAVQKSFNDKIEKIDRLREQNLRRAKIDLITVTTNEDYLLPLVAYFRRGRK